MRALLLVGRSEPILEGLAQLMASAGHGARIARSAAEAVEIAEADAPLVIIAERSEASEATLAQARLAPGGALVLFHGDGAEPVPVSPALRRLTLAELVLPLERQRMLALVEHVFARSRSTGRTRSEPPEHPSV